MNRNSHSFFREWSRALVSVALILPGGQDAGAQTETPPTEVASQDVAEGADAATSQEPGDVLSPSEWREVDVAVDRALQWLASQQQADGSFLTLDAGQPGVTCLCAMAFMSHGHVPGGGKYGAHIDRATRYALRCQKQNGLITVVGPDGPHISRLVHHEIGNSAAYNHAISSLMLAEVYGMGGVADADRMEIVISKALSASLEMQHWPKDSSADRGGWRYVDDFDSSDSDLSVTGWELMFLRSAHNAGFEVPEARIDEAVAYVRRCYSEKYGTFVYATGDDDERSRAMAGAGVLALAHAGFHEAPEAGKSGDWILEHDFARYNHFIQFAPRWTHDRYHYGLFNCCQGMYQLGGRHWQAFFPATVRTLLGNQRPDGSWPAESHHWDARFGNAYTTALVLLTFGAPNQLLPIFQR